MFVYRGYEPRIASAGSEPGRLSILKLGVFFRLAVESGRVVRILSYPVRH